MVETNCAECPLSEHCARSSANHSQSDIVVVLDQVDNSGLKTGYYCNSRDDEPLLDALRKQDLKRNHVSYVPMIRAQYPGMSRAKYQGQWERKHKKKWGKDVPTPEKCCEPWFADQISRYKNIIALGPRAASGVLRGNPGFDKTRGTPAFPDQSKYGHNVMLTWAGWMLRMDPKFVKHFKRDIDKAFRFFTGDIHPPDPTLVEVMPDSWRAQMEELHTLARKRKRVQWDLESSPYDYSVNSKGDKVPRYNTMFNPLIIAGMGWEDVAYVANFVKHEWPEGDKQGCIDAYGAILADDSVIKVGQNSLSYDALNMASLYGFEVNNHRDTLIMTRIVAPEEPKSLAFLAAAHTDAAGWKDGADYTDSVYNAMDCAITDQVYQKLDGYIRKSPQKHAYKKIAEFQETLNRVCRVGVPIDEAVRAQMEAKYAAIVADKSKVLVEVAGEEFNPRSNADIEKLLYDTWGLPVPKWTKRGAPATDKDAVIELLGSSLLDDTQRAGLDALRRYKLAATLLSTYLRPWRAGGAIVRDGRIYPGLNASGTVGARPSSSRPNMLTLPRVLGAVQAPPPGMAIVETDLSAAEFIYVIKAAGISSLQTAFDGGADLHGTIMKMLLGEAIAKLDGYPEGGPESGGKGTGNYSIRRTLQKNFNFASLYAAMAAAKRDILRKDMDKEWNLLNVGLTLGQVTAWDVALHRAIPELKIWWAQLRREHEREGFIRDDNWGLVRFMPNGFKPTEAANFKAQSSTAGYVNDALTSLIDHPLLTPNYEKGTGLYLTVYDSIKAVVPEEYAEEAGKIMHEAMVVNDRKTGLKINAETEIKYHAPV